MRALICHSVGDIRLEEVPEGEGPDNWIPVDIHAVGICGTDYHIFHGRQPFLEYPRIMGHELSGVVGPDASSETFVPGQNVLIDPHKWLFGPLHKPLVEYLIAITRGSVPHITRVVKALMGGSDQP